MTAEAVTSAVIRLRGVTSGRR